ncbi:MAG: M28 family peptidase [Gemmatimonadaceae bacterium]|nr:M28 family peptidase [Gemmatimonadaceae bacterium]
MIRSILRGVAASAAPVLLPAMILAGCTATGASPSPARTVAAITPADVRSRIYLIADDSMRGREAGTADNVRMTSYLEREVLRLGLEPGGENGTYYQTIPMVRRRADSASTLAVNGEHLSLFTDFVPLRPSSTVRFAAALKTGTYPVIYGGRAGDSTVALRPAEVAGRIVILDAPIGPSGQPTGVYTTPAGIAISRFPTAAGIAIAALDLVTRATASSLRSSGGGLSDRGTVAQPLPFGLLISRATAEKMMGSRLGSLQPGTRGGNVQADVRFAERPVTAPARNVIAILRGSDPALRGEYVAIGAHSDHIAVARAPVDHDSLRAYNRIMRPNGGDTRVAGPSTPTATQRGIIRAILDSLRRIRPPRPDSIYNGADDDGSGSVALLEIAESLAQGKRPRRSILFVWHTAEEAGLLGSAWFTGHATVPHDSIVAQLNMDMVGHGEKRDTPTGGPRNVQVIGSRRLSTDLGDVVDSVNVRMPQPYLIDYSFDAPRHVQNRYCRSDHYMYARTGIPIAYISRGYSPDYHMVTDEPQYISYDGLARVATFVRNIAVAVADRNDRVRVDKPKPDPLAPCLQ